MVHQYFWTGVKYEEQYAGICAIAEQWGLRKIVIDRTGLGDTMSSLLTTRLGEERVEGYQFTRPSKSKLTYQFLSLVNSGRLKMYQEAEAPPPSIKNAGGS